MEKWEENQLMEMLDKIASLRFNKTSKDTWLWVNGEAQVFTLNSAYKGLNIGINAKIVNTY